MNYYQIFFILIISCIYSCEESSIKDKDQFEIIDYKTILKNSIESNIIDDVEYIPLETNENCLIGNISRLLYRNGNFYLFDFVISNTIHVFDRSGKFLYKIDNIGKGPGEYVSISDFDVDKDGNIYVFDAGGKRRIIKYSNNGASFKSIKPSKFFLEFKLLNEDQLIAYLPFSSKGIVDGYGIINLNNGDYKNIIPFRELIDRDQHFHEYTHIFRSNNNIYFSPRYTNEIFKVLGDEVAKAYKFSSDVCPTEEYLKDLLGKKVRYIDNDKYILSISGIYETNNTIEVSFKRRKHHKLFISKNSGRKILMEKLSNTTPISDYNIYGSTGHKFICSTSDVLISDDLSIPQETKHKLLNRDSNSNPVLVLYKIKDF